MDKNVGLPVEDVALGLLAGGGVMPAGWLDLMTQNRAAQAAALKQGPTTGVYNGNQVAWEYLDAAGDIDLDYEEAVAELEADGYSEEEIDAELEYWEGGGTRLIGAWEQDVDGKWVAAKNGGPCVDFAAIYDNNDNYLQVVWSRYVCYGRWASPCFPGQVNARNDDPASPDEARCVPYYALPPEVLRDAA